MIINNKSFCPRNSNVIWLEKNTGIAQWLGILINLTHLPRFWIMTGTFTTYPGDFLLCVYKLFPLYLCLGSIPNRSDLYYVFNPCLSGKKKKKKGHTWLEENENVGIAQWHGYLSLTQLLRLASPMHAGGSLPVSTGFSLPTCAGVRSHMGLV